MNAVSQASGGGRRSLMRQATTRAAILLALIAGLAGLPANAAPQQDQTEETPAAPEPDQGPQLPAKLPDGRPVRAIGIYESQMDALIPGDYQTISRDRLNEAVARLTDRTTDDQTSRLKSAVYFVELADDMLVSDHSAIDIESDLIGQVRRSLGKVNLSILSPENQGAVPAIDALPRLESESDGNLVAVFENVPNVRPVIEFKWQLRGTVSGSGHEFLMQLPRAPQTRIVLSAPPDVDIEALDGVMRSWPGPPPDAAGYVTDREQRWYVIDAGGLSTVRIRAQPNQQDSDTGSFVVRRTSMTYNADPSGLTWNSRMEVQMPSDSSFPQLSIRGTTVTAVKVNEIDVAFTSKTLGGREQHLQVDLPTGIVDAKANYVKLEMVGHTPWTRRNGWTDLPMPVWIGDAVVYASAVDEVKLRVVDPLQVLSWQLPDEWRQARVPITENGITIHTAEGPPVALSHAADPTEADAGAATGRTWSRIRFINRPILQSSDTALKLEVTAGSLVTSARMAVSIDPSRVEPLRFRVENGWSLDSVTFVQSGRVIDNPGISDSRLLTLWPEREDSRILDDGSDEPSGDVEIVIEAAGTKLMPGGSAGLMIPPTWFIRPLGVRGSLVAAIVPPTDLNWSGEAAMQRGRIKPAELNEAQQEFFGGLDEETLLFRPDLGRTPTVTLQTPSVSFDATTLLQIARDRDELTEQLVVEIESQVQGLNELVVQTGPPENRPPLSWSISGSNDSPSTSLPTSDVTMGEDESQGIYTIDVSDKNLRGRRLIGRRRYAIAQPLQLELPSISGAASQSAEAIIGPGLLVKQKSGTVQLVPSRRELEPTNSDTASLQPLDLMQSLARESIRLRYDAVEHASITLEESDINPNVTIIWRERVRVTASSRGRDRIDATYTVSPTAPLEIEHDPELKLQSITRGGERVDLNTIPQRPIVLQPRSETETIRIAWTRSQPGSGWIRGCRIPRIVVSGSVLKSEYQLVAASDTFAPASLLWGDAEDGAQQGVVVIRPGDTTTLVRRNIALAIGWLFAMLMFAMSWFVAERSPLLVAALVVVSTTILILWWPWRLAVIGWLIVPIISAALLATSRAWGSRQREIARTTTQEKSKVRRTAQELSADFSLQTLGRFMVLMLVVGSALPFLALAQDPEEATDEGSQRTDTAVDVLVPVNRDGSLYGDMVYIPQSVYSELFSASRRSEPQDPRFQSASYRVTISPSINQNNQVASAEVEAEFLLHVKDGDLSSTSVRLPLEAALVRQIELVDKNPFVPFVPDSEGQIIATLPPGNAFRLRVTLYPNVVVAKQWSSMVLSIPPVASSQLTVETEQSIARLRLGGPSGRLLRETDLRRWVENLGPVDSLQIDFRLLDIANRAVAQPLERRYWIDAGKQKVSVDCELDPPEGIAIGETFQFIVRNSEESPIVTSSAWRLDGSEEISPTRRLITVTCTQQSPGPIRLLWMQPAPLNQPATVEPVPIEIPEVMAALGENAPAWIGVHCDPELQLVTAGEATDALSVDHFLAAWSGYYGQIDRAFIASGGIPAPILQTKQQGQASISQRHHLHVMPDRLELHYEATLAPSDTFKDRYLLRFPRGLELIRVTADDRELEGPPIRSGSSSEVLLGSFVGANPVSIEVIAVQRMAPNMRFTPPCLSLFPAASTTGQYTMSRDRSTTLRMIEPPETEQEATEQVTAVSLAEGWIPVSTWKLDSDNTSGKVKQLGGLYEVKARRTRFDCQQLIALTRDETHWSMETLIRFNSNRIPDFIDVEVPTRWCESLDVSPTTAWSRQPATDDSRQIIRIRCAQEELADRILSIRGQLEDSETGRVSVPAVRVLGLGGRRTHISVPDMVEDEPIQWRTSAVEAVRLPSQWRDRVPPAQRSTYLVANPSWSIDLAPLSEVDVDAGAINGDVQIFAQDDGALVLSHWDLFPGGLEAIDVQLPRGAICLGAWSAGQAVIAERVGLPGETAEEKRQRRLLRVPLALSRMSQPVEILIRVPASKTSRTTAIPKLIGIPLMQQWVTHYVPQGSNPAPLSNDDDDVQRRAIALARSVVEAVEAVDMVAERPRDEVAAWLETWVVRYRMIAQSMGHVVDFESQAEPYQSTESPSAFDASAAAQRLSLPSHLQWNELDSRMAVYANRFLTDRASQDSFLFRVAGFDGYVVDRVARLSAADRPSTVQPVSLNDRGLRKLIINCLTLVLVCGLLACVRPAQAIAIPVVSHPAFWLGLIGICGFVVAPVPVAIAILLVSVTLPMFPFQRRPSRG